MVCEQCGQGFVMSGEPQGRMVDDAYLHEGSNKSRAIIFLTDIFGLPLVNCKIMADKLSKELDCDVWIPDLFAGRPPMNAEEMEPLVPDRAGVKLSFMNIIRLVLLLIPRAHLLYAARSSVVDARVDKFIAKVKAEHNYQKLGAVGYCFGGSVAIRIGSRDIVDSIVIAHPGQTSIGEIRAIKIPAAWECAEDDMSFGKKLRDEAEAVFAARKDKPDYVEYEFKDYPGTAHGFAARPNFGLPNIVKAYNDSFTQTVMWFNKTLQV
ncbi:dienelactone hydrolase endo-1,3,1,4-beta-D-glucanase [Cristinia sonorae]|uniref:Dienelactone hydrolase endo-1,3,1,4-beta-D-glucanase n=1 Tax=Cristinia sonorae TaxID=1940300 RepID=A0A8K0UWD6_9AGAR|nr:dienelactone hydrolase endo-1,3,1,4-beta-D-glucanase [Cristinia sonorae]